MIIQKVLVWFQRHRNFGRLSRFRTQLSYSPFAWIKPLNELGGQGHVEPGRNPFQIQRQTNNIVVSGNQKEGFKKDQSYT